MKKSINHSMYLTSMMHKISILLFFLFLQTSVYAQEFEHNPIFEKLKKGINQDASMAFSGVWPKIQHERSQMLAMKEAGFESVRIFLPYTSNHIEFETRIQDALDHDLAIVVCMWGAYYWIDDPEIAQNEIYEKWKMIAEDWKDKFSDHVVFEILNETKGIGYREEETYPDAMKLYEAGIVAIREVDADRPILIGPPGYNDADKLDPWVGEQYLHYPSDLALNFFNDPNIGISIHFYRPNDVGNNFAMGIDPLGKGWETKIDYNIESAANWAKKYNTNMPIIVTEWGCWLFEERNNSEDLPTWLAYHMNLFEENNFGSIWYTGVQSNQRVFSIFDSEFGWEPTVLKYLTGIKNPIIPSTSQIMDAEFLDWGSKTWKLTDDKNVKKDFVLGDTAISGKASVRLTVNKVTDCQMYQQSLEFKDHPQHAPNKNLLHLLKDNTYEVSFLAKSEGENGEISIQLQNADRLSTVFYQSEIQTLSQQTQLYTIIYEHQLETANNIRLAFDVGTKVQAVIIDKVILRHLDQPQPSKPTLIYSTNESIVLQEITGYEYSIDNGITWNSSATFQELSAKTTYSVHQRKATVGLKSASPSSETLLVTTAKENAPTAIDNQFGKTMVVYPNPASSYIKIKNIPIGTQIMLLDLSGKVIQKVFMNDENEKIGISHLKSGTYFIKTTFSSTPLIVQ